LFSKLDFQNIEGHAKSTEIGVMRDSHPRLCVLVSVFWLQNKSKQALSGAILPNPTANMPESNRPGSDPETLRSKAPQHVPVLVQHAIATTMWGEFIFVFAVRNTQSDRCRPTLTARVPALEQPRSDLEFRC